MIRAGLLGPHGRMGKWVATLLAGEYAQSATLGAMVGRNDAQEPLLATDVVIDFSTPTAMYSLAELALRQEGELPAFVVGSTGWRVDERRKLEELGQRTPVLMASNFSTGVMALLDILRSASPLLEKLGYTPVVVETHHRHKKDAPSGTAISIQRAIAPAGPGNVQTHSIRAGEVIGDHEATFYGPGDHLTFGHFAQDRSIFARGAIDVALWLAGRRKGPSPLRGLVGIDAYFKDIKEQTQ